MNGSSSRCRRGDFKNGKLEPWDFAAAYGRAGWTNDRLSAHIVSPVKDALVVEAVAWTPGTNGPVRAQAVRVTLPQRPTRESLAAELEKTQGKRARQSGARRRAAAGARVVQPAGTTSGRGHGVESVE